MSEEEHYFTCPSCGGHYFGSEINSGLEFTGVVNCHNRDDGKPFLCFDEWLLAGRPKQKFCGWSGLYTLRKNKMNGAELITEERVRHIEEEGYDALNDDRYINGELALAGICYAAPERIYIKEDGYNDKMSFVDPWPWCEEVDKRLYDHDDEECKILPIEDRIRMLVKGGALIAAEIDRLLRLDKDIEDDLEVGRAGEDSDS